MPFASGGSSSALDLTDVDRFEQKKYCYSVKVRDIVKLIEKDGWYWVRTKGSHHQYKHQTKPGLVTVPGNPGDDVASGTLNNILKQAGLKP
jgi:predicted RNA binding protein YcfA (HicA-like mRNA interferase family)